MKKLLISALALMLLFTVGCNPAPSAPAASVAPAVSEAPSSAGIPNPVAPVENATAFEKLGVSIEAPAGASDVAYSIIAGKLAQIGFTFDNRAYTYRAAKTEEDISGVYDTFDNTSDISVDGEGWYAIIRIQTNNSGNGALATWQYPPVSYSLFTPGAVDAKAFQAFATELAHSAYQAANPSATAGA